MKPCIFFCLTGTALRSAVGGFNLGLPRRALLNVFFFLFNRGLPRSIDANHSAAHLTGVAPEDGTRVANLPHYVDYSCNSGLIARIKLSPMSEH